MNIQDLKAAKRGTIISVPAELAHDLIMKYEGAQFAAESHLKTVKTQQAIIAGYQARQQPAPIQSAELRAWLSGLEDVAHDYTGAQLFTKVRTYLQGCGYLSQPERAKPTAIALTDAQIIATVEEYSSGQSMSANYIFRRARIIEMVRHLTTTHGETQAKGGA